MAKAMNRKRRLKAAFKAALEEKRIASKVELEMILSFRNRRFVDRRRQAGRLACRGKVQD